MVVALVVMGFVQTYIGPEATMSAASFPAPFGPASAAVAALLLYVGCYQVRQARGPGEGQVSQAREPGEAWG